MTENLVQCVARDILADAVLRCEIAGMRVILHVHDEIVVEVGRGRTKAVGAEDLKALMETPPEWAADLPIEAEVKESDKYEK